jgi:hypothetical protein
MSHIFISYSRKDKKVVAQYVESLRKQDFIVWQDVSNISAGEKWHQALLDAIEQSSAVMVFWTQSAYHSPYVNEEIDQALKHGKHIIPVWLESATPLRDGLKEANAVISNGFSSTVAQKISHALLEKAPRIQRQVMDFNTSIPMNAQTISGISREIIGSREYMVVPLITSVYSSAYVIAEAGTIVRQVGRIQLIVQNTGPVDYATIRDAFKAILVADAEYSDEAEPLVGLYVTGAMNPMDSTQYWVDNTNVAHYSDMVDTTRKAISSITKNAADTQMFQMFQKTLVDIAFLLGVSLDRWLPLQLYKWEGGQYVPIINIPPRSPN